MQTHDQQQETNRVTYYFRIGRIILLTLLGLLIAAIFLPLANKPWRLKLIRWWCRRLLNAFNLRVITSGYVPNGNQTLDGVMFVANHISWADIHALNTVTPLGFIAKSEIKDWPVFGYLARKSGTLFIDRNRRHDAARTVNAIVKSLQQGNRLGLFPEGTTTDGREIKPFKSSLIQAAIQANAVIWPVAIYYPHPAGGSNTLVAYANDITLHESLRNMLNQQQPIVELRFLQPINTAALSAQDKDRRVLTDRIQAQISQTLYGRS